jgi:hypothetical protein
VVWRRRRRETGPSVAEFLEGTFFVSTGAPVVVDEDGERLVAGFTSQGLFERFAPEADTSMPLNGSNVLVLLLESDCVGVVIDPGEPGGFTIARSVAEQLVAPSSEALWAGPKVLVAEPDEPPPASLVNALQRACERDPELLAAYVFVAAVPGRESHPQVVLGLELASGELSDELLAALREAAVPPADAAAGLGGYMSIDLHVLDEELLPLVRDHGIAVYRRT